MTFTTLKTHLKALPCGKKLNHSVYIVEESLEIVDKKLYKFVADLKTRTDAGSEYNVIKFFTNEFKISYLSYPDFFKAPHPGLKKSLTLNIATGKTRKFNYDKSINPPILHRKETFLHPEHHLIQSQIPDNTKTAVIPIIDRHKTAITRYNFSKPVQGILEYNLLDGERIPLAPNPLFFTALSGYRRAVQAVFPPPLLLPSIVEISPITFYS